MEKVTLTNVPREKNIFFLDLASLCPTSCGAFRCGSRGTPSSSAITWRWAACGGHKTCFHSEQGASVGGSPMGKFFIGTVESCCCCCC